ncbi:MAG: replicative DNA helicase [Angelakisella sp.]
MADSYSVPSGEFYNQSLPFSLEAEQSVLGAAIIDPGKIPEIMEFMKPEYFYRKQHSDLYALLVNMFSTGASIDIVTILDNLRKEGVFDTPEDAKVYLMQLAKVVPTTANVAAYARIVQEKYYLRSLITASREIVDSASDSQADATELLNFAEQKIYDIRQGKDTSGNIVPLSKVLVETYDHLQKISGSDRKDFLGISTGYSALDSYITGLNKSDLILIAARPGMGKTAFALNIAANVGVRSKKTVAVFSLEMGKEQLAQRLLSSEALVESQKLRVGNLTDQDWVNISQATGTLAAAPIYIDDSAGITVAEIKAKLRRIRDLGLVVIDYLQLMTGNRRTENRVQEVSEITRNLKIMAKELCVPVITLSQLSRGTESRSDHKPMLSDLRESGSIEQDADIVMFLYREAYYSENADDQTQAKCIIAKNRHGSTGTVDLFWDGQFTRFSSVQYSPE